MLSPVYIEVGKNKKQLSHHSHTIKSWKWYVVTILNDFAFYMKLIFCKTDVLLDINCPYFFLFTYKLNTENFLINISYLSLVKISNYNTMQNELKK